MDKNTMLSRFTVSWDCLWLTGWEDLCVFRMVRLVSCFTCPIELI